MIYSEVIENLKNSIIDKKQGDLFKPSLMALKNGFGIDCTTQFLKNLVGEDTRKIQNRIYFLMRKNGLMKFGIIKGEQHDKTILRDVYVDEHTFKEFGLVNKEKHANNPQFKEFFKGCGELALIDGVELGHNVQVLTSYKVNAEHILDLIV